MTRIGVITNPNSRKNQRQHDREAALRRIVGNGGLVRQTASVDDLEPVVEELLDEGVEYLVSDGGDGTFHWMLNKSQDVLEGRRREIEVAPRMVPTNGGTIDFVAKKAGIKGRADNIIRALVGQLEAGRQPANVELDTLRIEGRHAGAPEDNATFHRLGFAIAIGGIGQRFFAKYYAEPEQGPLAILRVIGKSAVGFWSTLPGMGRLMPWVPEQWVDCGSHLLAGTKARVRADGRDYPYPQFQGLHAGSVDVTLGSLKLFPLAREPGKIHFAIGDVNRLEGTFYPLFLFAGQAPRGRRWSEFAGEELEVWAEGEELLDPVIDGEIFSGLEYLKVTRGPKVTVPTLTA